MEFDDDVFCDFELEICSILKLSIEVYMYVMFFFVQELTVSCISYLLWKSVLSKI